MPVWIDLTEALTLSCEWSNAVVRGVRDSLSIQGF